VSRVALDERHGAIDRDGHRRPDVLVVARRTIGFRSPVCVGQDPTLREDGRGIAGEEHDARGGGEALARARIVPDKAAQRGPGQKLVVGEPRRRASLGSRDEPADDVVVEILPADPVQAAGLERRGGLDRLPGDLVDDAREGRLVGFDRARGGSSNARISCCRGGSNTWSAGGAEPRSTR
jgi:hypothetical protein